MADEAWQKGQKKREELFGAEGGGRLDVIQKFDDGFAKILNNVCFGDVWSRPGLPIKTRSMLTMASLIALGRFSQLKGHMKGALHVGVTENEIKEVIIHLSQYAGIPFAVEAIRVFNEVKEGK
jgi:4-carboxymuconolactone decarboxylase